MKKIDLAFSPEGDLLLGPPRIDSDGAILYRHPDGSITTEEGLNGKVLYDFAYVRNRDALRQNIMNRLKSDNPDWYHHSKIGGNLSDLIGEPNTKETGDLGATYIYNSLTYSNLVSPYVLSVRPVPINSNEILFLITIDMGTEESYKLPVVFNLERGLKEVE